jgi:hypothetical protein
MKWLRDHETELEKPTTQLVTPTRKQSGRESWKPRIDKVEALKKLLPGEVLKVQTLKISQTWKRQCLLGSKHLRKRPIKRTSRRNNKKEGKYYYTKEAD